MSEHDPWWAGPKRVDGWPTERATLSGLGLSLEVPQGWCRQPPTLTNQGDVIVWTGSEPLEQLEVHAMLKADPSGQLPGWIEGLVALTGSPLMPNPDVGLTLLEWGCVANGAELASPLGVEDAYAYAGVGAVEAPAGRSLRRIYAMLTRSGVVASKVVLSFSSACPPGMPAAMVHVNDHVRAAATFANLEYAPRA